MALVKCPDCGRDVSDQAPACVGCGRPMAAPTEPPEVCEVILRQLSDGGMFGDAHWQLVAQVMYPTGIKVAASREYHSKNYLAEYQGEYKGFQQARQEITDELLRAGWTPTGSVPGGGAVTLPRFQREPRREGPAPAPWQSSAQASSPVPWQTPRSGAGGAASLDGGPSMTRLLRVRCPVVEVDRILSSFLAAKPRKLVSSAAGVFESRYPSSDFFGVTVRIRSLGPLAPDETEIEVTAWIPHDKVYRYHSGFMMRYLVKRDLTFVLDKFQKQAPFGGALQLSSEREAEIKAMAEYLKQGARREEDELEAAGAVSEWPDSWWPTHLVPAGGMPFWTSSDSSQRPAGQLAGGLELMMEFDPESGQSAQVTAMNGWMGWVDGRLLEDVPDWTETHLAPAGGMAFWKSPDPSQPPTGQLPGRTRLVMNSRSGDWANVTAVNGWRGWVDGRLLGKCDAHSG